MVLFGSGDPSGEEKTNEPDQQKNIFKSFKYYIMNLEYNLHKIADNQKLLIEILSSKTKLTKEQSAVFGLKFNENQNLMRETAILFYTEKKQLKKAEKIKSRLSYVTEVVKLVEAALYKLKKETKSTFKNEYIKFINTNNF